MSVCSVAENVGSGIALPADVTLLLRGIDGGAEALQVNGQILLIPIHDPIKIQELVPTAELIYEIS